MHRLLSSLLLVLASAVGAQAWVDAVAHDGVVYVLRNAPPVLSRYDLTTGAWLADAQMASGPTAMTVGSSGVFVAFARRISRFTHAGTGEVHLQNTTADVTGLVLAGPLIASLPGYDGLLSIDSVSGAFIAQADIFYSIRGLSAARSKRRIFGRTTGVSPSDILRVQLAANGQFLGSADSPYHGDYPGASRTFVFPDDTRVADDAGIVYQTNDLTFAGSLAGPFGDLAFYGNLPIVLRGKTLYAYDAAYREVGRYELPAPAVRIFVQGDVVFAFTEGLSVTPVPLSAFGPLTPGEPVNPDGLAFDPEQVAQRSDGTVFLLDRGTLSIFRWLPATRAWGDTIPLAEAPTYMAYSKVTDRLYLAYPSGRITQIDLATSDAEAPFASSPQTPCGLATAGDVVFVCDPSGAWVSHFTYRPDGTLVSQVEWNYESDEYVWNESNRKMYFFRDDTSPNDILSEDIAVDGTIGQKRDSPYHGNFSFRHPIRIAPDGDRVLTGQGIFFDAQSLAHAGSLSNPIVDAVWVGGTLYTLRLLAPQPPPIHPPVETAWGISEVQVWGPGNYPLVARMQVPGLPRRLFVFEDTPIALTAVGGVPRWTPLTCGNGIIESYEACDGGVGEATCASLGLGTGPVGCSPSCTFDTSGCSTPPSCGNGVVDRLDEVCDGQDGGVVGAELTCAALGFVAGTISCAPGCGGFDTTTCTSCGNDVRDAPGEDCDGTDLGGTCQTYGFAGGELGCFDTCDIDTSGCTTCEQSGGCGYCGDGLVDHHRGEQCDGSVGDWTCVDFGYSAGGTLACTDCVYDPSNCVPGCESYGCPECGDGVVNGSLEQCDGAALAGATCEGLGFGGGTLSCTGGCAFDTSACEPACPPAGCQSSSCGDGIRDVAAGEECDGDDVGDATCASRGFEAGTIACTAACRLDDGLCRHDCSAAGCDDGLPCTLDGCNERSGCVTTPIAGCMHVGGYATVTDGRRRRRPARTGRCRDEFAAGLEIHDDGTYRVRRAATTCADGTTGSVPDEIGTVKRRRDREVLIPSNLIEISTALTRCAGHPVDVRKRKSWIRRDESGRAIGESVTTTFERRREGAVTRLTRTRFAILPEAPQMPDVVGRLPQCASSVAVRW